MDHTGGLSSRTAAIIVAGAIAASLVLFLVAILIPGFGRVNGAVEVADVGEPISVRVDNDLDIRVDLTVSSVRRVTTIATASKAKDELQVYLVRYSIDGIGAVEPSTASTMWQLVAVDGTVYESDVYELPETSACGGFDHETGEGCAAVLVPAGTELDMVRYHGAKNFWYPGKPTPADTWAGWQF